MTTANIYSAPAARVADPATTGFSNIDILSAKGRLGRVRYIAYSIGIGFLINILASLLSALVTSLGGESVGIMVYLGGMAAAIWLHALLSVQRAHDFNTTGWLAILAFIPLLNFIFWFVPGTNGDNRFGRKTPPNTRKVILGALIIPIIMVLGIAAAIAIPVYQNYVEQARSSQSQ